MAMGPQPPPTPGGGNRVARLQTLALQHREETSATAAGPASGHMPTLRGSQSQRLQSYRSMRGAQPVVVAPQAAVKSGSDSPNMNTPRDSTTTTTSPRPPSAASPTAAGKYSDHVLQSETLLGTGAFGAVYLGVHELTGEMIAIKKVRLGTGSEESRKQVELLVSEIKLMKQLVHPNIVRYLHAERQGDSLCIFMEYMSGGSLGSFLKKFKKLSPGIVKTYMRHALQGIDYLHKRNIVHRDIKPDNILVSASGDAKLSDFGTSREFSDSSNLLTVTGTPWFMAPEVVKGSGHGAPADMWSVGCSLIQLIRGVAPLEEFSNPITAMYQIATHPEKVIECIPKDIPADLQDVMRRCLSEDPLARATAAQLLEHPFFRVGSDGNGASSSGAVPRPLSASAKESSVTKAGVPSVSPLPAPSDAPSTPAAAAAVGTPRSFAAKLREQTHSNDSDARR